MTKSAPTLIALKCLITLKDVQIECQLDNIMMLILNGICQYEGKHASSSVTVPRFGIFNIYH